MKLRSYVAGAWYEAPDGFTEVASAVDGRTVARVSSKGIDFARVLDHARGAGGSALRALTFHQRAELIKRLALYLDERKERFYELAFDTGARGRGSTSPTSADRWSRSRRAAPSLPVTS